MKQLVPVPHRNSLPTTQIGNPYSFSPRKQEYADDFEQAMDLVQQEFQDYTGYPKLQDQLIVEALDDIAFHREVREAAVRIAEIAIVSPIYSYEGIVVKDETQQPTQAYKIRGATNFIMKYADLAVEKGVVTASAGNHGQAVALAASKLGVKETTIVVPEGTPTVKKDGIESYGARVIVHGHDYAEANMKALELNNARHGLYAPAYDHRDIMAGQATMALELLEQVPEMSDLVVSTGGGGALAGSAKFLRTAKPNVKVWGSGIAGSSAVANAFRNGNNGIASVNKFADGIAVAKLGILTWPEIQRSVKGALTVTERDVRIMIGRLASLDHIVEGAGAVGLTAALFAGRQFGNCPVAIVTGGNIDLTELQACRELAG